VLRHKEDSTAKKIIPIALAFFVCAALVGSGHAQYYKGKTIHFNVGLSAGGGFDVYTRLIGRHFSKHVPGNPSIVVDNVTGAGGLILANQFYNNAKPDGLTIATYPGPIILRHVLGYKGVLLDGRKLRWLVALTPAAQACALSKASGIKSAEEWLASKKPIKLGGLAPGDDTIDLPKIVKATTNLPIQIIEGFKGVANVRLAVESGEVDGACFNWYGMKGTWQNRIESGDVRVVLQNLLEPHPDLKNVPLVTKFAKNREAAQLLESGLKAYAVPMYVYNAPPGTPDERVETLRKAFMETLRDRAFIEESQKAKLDVEPIDGAELANVFASLYQIPANLVTQLSEIVVPQK
jgi:tripartite-type tricarboxylate transporter receptor subunit TctC